MTILLAVTAAAIGVALFSLTYAMAIAPSGDATRLGLRGLKRRRVLTENGLWRSVEPAVRWLGRRLRGLFSDSQISALDLQLTRAGDFMGLIPDELLGLSVLCGAGASLVGLGASLLTQTGAVVVAFVTAFGVFAPFMILSSTTDDRYHAITRRLPNVIDLLALAMSAGLDFPSAIRQIVEKAGNASDPLVEELCLILQSLRLGRTRRQALEEFAHRVPCRAIVEFTGAVVQAELRGTPLASVLMLQAETARFQRTVHAEEAASKAGVKLLIPLALIFLCTLLMIVAPMVIRLNGSSS